MSSIPVLQLYVDAQSNPLGPMPWFVVREWLFLGWLPSDVRVKPIAALNWVAASELPKLNQATVKLRELMHAFAITDLASERIPVSAAQASRLRTLGWPGEIDRLHNYYWANYLRVALEKITTPTPTLFDDPDWPLCWGGADCCPARYSPPPERLRRPQEEVIAQRRATWLQTIARGADQPATNRQMKVLKFFNVITDGQSVTFGEAMRIVPAILNNDENLARWNAYKNLTGDRGHESPNLLPH